MRLVRDFGVTLAGFLHSNRFNVYLRPNRIRGLDVDTPCASGQAARLEA
ncbi:MAG: hypothetical protein M3120_01405 [Pseudomonadota bacterium]|nr:hypothetical protein [Pseudomonadota bacterium]